MSATPTHEPCVAVLGRRDEPTDAVEEYCRYLADGLKAHGASLEIARVRWAETGWHTALRDFLAQYPSKKDRWFFLQYTALAWSRRGIPLRFMSILRRLKSQGARCTVVFHDVDTYPGGRMIDRVRRALQLRTMRRAALLADLAIFTVPTEKISWLAGSAAKAAFIPVGANLPEPEKAWAKPDYAADGPPSVAVFAITGGEAGTKEAKEIADAALFASKQIGLLRVVLLGRNSETAKAYFAERFRGSSVQVKVLGLLPAEQVVQALGACDVLLFVRAPISSRRGSAIAGIACGLPVVAREGWETAPPITRAGIEFVQDTQQPDFGPALLRILTDNSYRASLAERSRQAQQSYFSWRAIAAQYLDALRESNTEK